MCSTYFPCRTIQERSSQGSNIDADHCLVVCKIGTRFWNDVNVRSEGAQRYNMQRLTVNGVAVVEYTRKLNKRTAELQTEKE